MKTFSVPGRQPVLALLMQLFCAAAIAWPAFAARAGVVLTTLHSFQAFPNGVNPETGLVQGSDGYFYGTTCDDGTNGPDYGYGTVFRISTNGALTTLYSFTGGNDGAFPSGLVQGNDGYFYGTTQPMFGFSIRYSYPILFGTVFKISTNGALTTLYTFTGSNDGWGSEVGLAKGGDGYFYGTTFDDGTNLAGTVFQISSNGSLTTLYSFTGGNDGGNPYAPLVKGSDGDFYGTTQTGGAYTNEAGTVFKINAKGALTSLYSFTGTNDGGGPAAALVEGSDGYFYGTTEYGGTNFVNTGGVGTVFKISADGALTSLYSFTGGDDGWYPYGGLVQGSDGYFYGTTSGDIMYGYGTVFKINANGAFRTLYAFGSITNAYGDTLDGANPGAGLVQGSDGSLYGTTGGGGTDGGYGTVFEISTNGALTSLFSFPGDNDGAYPYAGLVQGSDGYFYGTTSSGGTNDYGSVFRISSSGALTSLYSFTGGDDGWYPYGGLVQGSDGYFYGTTEYGGTYGSDFGGYGTVFQISPNGTLTSLHSFAGGNEGVYPVAGLVQGSDGNLYGTTVYNGVTSGYHGGPVGDGTVFTISTAGALTTLHSFTGDDGANPVAGLVQGSDGYFYGTTSAGGSYGLDVGGYGTVFKISTNGVLTTLHSFTTNDGGNPVAGLVQGSDGYFYGTTLYSSYSDWFGYYGGGTVFKISANGALTTLYSFTGGNDEGQPQGGLVQGSDGSLYGTTEGVNQWAGFAYGAGTVFQISTNGSLITLYSFSGGNDGGYPYAGTVFRLTIVPEFQAVTLTSSTLNLTWSTEAGGTYQLQCTSNLSSSNWTNLGSAVTATGATLATTDSLTNGPQRFYRLVLLP
jgi:uncharacterized repeat protein (TIGR03803 family)